VVTRRVGDQDYDFTAESFFQTNHKLLEALVKEAVGQARGQNAVDLYCGVGLFTLPLARRFARVVAVESNTSASKYAVRNLSHAGLENVSVVTSKVSEWLRRHASSYDDLDFLLLDPPRTGAEPNVIHHIVRLRPHHISYVSCDPATLARDLKELLDGGYRIDSISAFDMFPQTHHVETLVHLLKD
jgi:23S rRNA (uracil1939-C5)-methyltransferase